MSFLVNPFFGASAVDPYWSSVVLLTPFNADELDHSISAHTLTASGSPTISATNPPSFQSQSVEFGSGNVDYYTIPNDADFDFGSGDFTVEGYLYSRDIVTDGIITLWGLTGDQKSWGFYNDGNGTIEFFWSTTGANEFSSTYNHGDHSSTWRHFAFSRVGSTGHLCYDGLIRSVPSFSGVTLFSSSATLAIAANNQGASARFFGNLAQLRITKGVGRYSGAVNDAITVDPPFPES